MKIRLIRVIRVACLEAHADSLHLAIKRVTASDIYSEYFTTVEILGNRFQLSEKDVLLAFDYTEENFYGDVQGFWIYGWTGEHAVTGKFKFLTCSIVSSDIPQKIPLISIPVYVALKLKIVLIRFYGIRFLNPSWLKWVSFLYIEVFLDETISCKGICQTKAAYWKSVRAV